MVYSLYKYVYVFVELDPVLRVNVISDHYYDGVDKGSGTWGNEAE